MIVLFQEMFPAGAGMNRATCSISRMSGYVPRRRGDEPSSNDFVIKLISSTQARG